MRIIATSDAHLPKGEAELQKAIETSCSNNKADLLILAGDIIDKGRIEFYNRALDLLSLCEAKTIIGVFGNEEYEELRAEIVRSFSKVVWLDDTYNEFKVNGEDLLIFGSTGILDFPTKWQRKNIPGIEKKYAYRLEKFGEFLKTEFAGQKIAIFHYPPTYKTLHGEPTYAWAEMGSAKAEELIKKYGGVNLIIHGHAHRSKILQANIGGIEIYNVALPARKGLFEYDLKKGYRTLLEFMSSEDKKDL